MNPSSLQSLHVSPHGSVGSAVVVGLIGSPVVGSSGLAVVRSVEQSLSAKEFGMGIATKSSRPNLKVVSDFVHLHVLMSSVQWNLKMSLVLS